MTETEFRELSDSCGGHHTCDSSLYYGWFPEDEIRKIPDYAKHCTDYAVIHSYYRGFVIMFYAYNEKNPSEHFCAILTSRKKEPGKVVYRYRVIPEDEVKDYMVAAIKTADYQNMQKKIKEIKNVDID